jgi:argininosuccinate lyase
MAEKVWGGRFREDLDEVVERFNASLPFDRRLYAQDIQGSIAHCRMLAKQGIISKEDGSRMETALAEIKIEMDQDGKVFEEDYEDIHTLVEKRLIQKVGVLGEKLHTGRSRNDQVALDVRMFVREAIQKLVFLTEELQEVLVSLAEKNREVIAPGYTHLQRAQPILLSHHLLAYYEMMKRDRQRLLGSLERVNVMPLGSAALAGSTFDLDRQMVANELGFDAISRNSMDAVSDRDFVLEFLFHAAVIMMHLSRLSEELVIWATKEFDFVALPEAFCTGSSMMPQKKNPDVPELIRGKTGRVYGHLISLLTTMKGLPLTYNKDMQEDKEPLFDAFDTVEGCLSVMTRLLRSVSFNKEAMRKAVDKGYLVATELADYLVKKGVTFRHAHEIVGKMVSYAIGEDKELGQLTLEEMGRFASQIEKDVYDWLDPTFGIKRKEIDGGTGPEVVRRSIERAREELGL